MRKRIYIVLLAVVMLLPCIVFAGCRHSFYREMQSVGFFQNHEKEDYIQIVGLTESGAQQEVLVVPPFLKNKPVKVLGYYNSYYGPRDAGFLSSDMTKKIYFPWTVESMWSGAKKGLNNLEEEVHLGVSYMGGGLGETTPRVTRYVCLPEHMGEKDRKFTLPNVIYNFNYEDSPNLGYYWIDYITGSNLHVEPESPIRQGYDFTRWYLEENCETEWNGSLPESETEELKLYAGWNEK